MNYGSTYKKAVVFYESFQAPSSQALSSKLKKIEVRVLNCIYYCYITQNNCLSACDSGKL